jgi:hypothetical protein
MPSSAHELLAQRGDRALVLMRRNSQLSDSWFGLTHLLATLSEEEGWTPEQICFESPHLSPNGLIRMPYRVQRGRGARYYSSFQEGDFGQFLANTNAAVVEFLTRCRTWRASFDQIHTLLENFSIERSIPVERLQFSVGRAIRGLAWFRVFTNSEQKVEDTRWHASHKNYR